MDSEEVTKPVSPFASNDKDVSEELDITKIRQSHNAHSKRTSLYQQLACDFYGVNHALSYGTSARFLIAVFSIKR